MNVRPNLRQDQMDNSAGHSISPSFVKGSERFEVELKSTVKHIGVDLVGSCTALNDQWAEEERNELLYDKSAEVKTCTCLDPSLEVRNPGVIAFDLSILIELPEGDLQSQPHPSFR